MNVRERITQKNCFLSFVCLLILFPLGGVFSQAYYYDGDRKISVTEETQLLAEVAGLTAGSVDTSLVKRADSGAELVRSLGGIRIWKTDPIATKTFLAKTAGTQVSDRLLPVVRTEGGSLLVPTGNIIVYLPIQWNDDQVRSWAKSKKSQAIQKLPIVKHNVWEIQTPPGLESIRIANGLQESGEVIYAMPNFWMEFSKK